jgi:aspartyl protease family protein
MARLTDNKTILTALLLLACPQGWCMPDVQVNGLLPNQAVVTIDGKQQILKVGKPGAGGVSLISADSKKAVLEWQGERFERMLTRQITNGFSAPAQKDEVRITRGRNDHYFTPGHINGRLVNFMVDTGASSIAMNYSEADRLGINWRNGERFMASTAGGETPSYVVTLDTVSVGDITLNNVKAAVIVAETGTEILLGNTFLSKTEMREENNTLVLRKKF